MSEQNVEIVREVLDAFRRRDHEREFQLLAENVVWDTTRSGIPGADDVFRRHHGVREFWTNWLDAWEEIEWDVPEFLDAGDRVVVEFRQRNKGRGSGIWIEWFSWWGVYEFADGRVLKFTYFPDRDEALAAAGLA